MKANKQKEKKTQNNKLKHIFYEIIRWGALAVFIVAVAIILGESAMPGQQSADQSGDVADKVEDNINDNYDKDNLVEITNFDISLESDKDIYYVGESVSYNLVFTPGNTTYKSIIMTSSDSSIVNINQSEEKIYFNAPGSATITAQSERNHNLIKTLLFNVQNVEVEEIIIEEKQVTLQINDVYLINSTVLPDNATDKTLLYSSSDSSIVSVENTGVVTAKKAGFAAILIKSASNEQVTTTINIDVKETVSTEINMISHEDVSLYPGETIKTNAKFGPVNSSFEFKYLKIQKLNDTNNSLTIKTAAINYANSTFGLNITSKTTSEPSLIDVKLIYDNGVVNLEDEFTVNINETKTITSHDVDQTKLTTSYDGNIYENSYYKNSNKIPDQVKISIPYKQDVTKNSTHYNTKNFEWTVSDNLKIVSKTFKEAKIEPKELIDCSGWVEFKPNINEDVKFKFTLTFSVVLDSSKISDIQFNKLYTFESDNKVNNLFVDQEYNSLFINKIIASGGKFNNSFTSTGVMYDLKQGSENVIELIYKEGQLDGIKTLNNEGTAEILVTSKFEKDNGITNPLSRTIKIQVTKQPNKSILKVNNEIYSSNDEFIINKNEQLFVEYNLYNITVLKDGSEYENYIEIPYNVKISDSELITYNKENKVAHGINGGSSTITFMPTDSSLSYLSKSLNIKVDYVPINVNSISLEYTLISNDPFNSPNKDYSIVPVGCEFLTFANVNEDATYKAIHYKSSNPEILSVDNVLGLVKAIKTGTATLTYYSAENPSISLDKEITVVNSSSMFTIDFGDIDKENVSTIKEGDLISGYNVKVYYGATHSIKIKPLNKCSSTHFSVIYSDEDIIALDGGGTLSTNKVGKTTATVTFGDEDCLNKYSLDINFEVVRKTISYSELHRIVRKLFGHYGLFLATALAGMIFICMTFKGWKNKIFATLVYSVIGFVVAGGSELIQKYTPGRGPSWKDVGIDFGGFMTTTGVFLLVFITALLIKFIIKKHKENKIKAAEKAKLPPAKPKIRFIVVRKK